MYSILRSKCPHCHEGKFFKPTGIGEIEEKCNECGEKFSKEPGFYYGAMYVSYALAVAVFVTMWVAISVLAPDTSAGVTVAWIIAPIVILGVKLYKLSRIIWANMFFSYKKPAQESEDA